MNLVKKPELYRWIVASSLWIVLTFCVVLTTHAAGQTAQAARAVAKSATSDDIKSSLEVAEFARAFATEWASWTGDEADYNKRIKIFNPALNEKPSGVPQRVDQSAVLSVVKKNQPGLLVDVYMVNVYLHVIRQEKEKTVEDSFTARVSVKATKEGKYFATSTPLVVPTAAAPEAKAVGYMESPDETVKALIVNFLKGYYGSTRQADILNYIVPDAGIVPVGNWTVQSVDQITVDSKINPTKATVLAVVKPPGANLEIKQLICFELIQRSGQTFIKTVYPG